MTEKGKQLKIACVREGFTQREIARAAGVSPALISMVLAGERRVNERKKKIIARILNRPTEAIFD
ncbi:MAG: helix-turn-helix transcriptional regulator [Actinobacteria bacterium]|nr:helix-turn-helix transcriptional regulator [Actinomycetota bacterium]